MKDPVQEGKELYEAGRLQGEWPADELLARVEALRVFRESIPVKRKKMQSRLVIGILGAVVFGVLSGALPGFIAGICAIGLVAGIALFIVSVITIIRLGLKKYDRDAADVIGPIVRCIGPDMARGAPFKVNASLKLPTASDLLVKKGEKYAAGQYQRCHDNLYKREVLGLECRLSDRTRLQADVVEHTIEKVLSKKNARGKWKTKKKYRRKIAFRVRLQLDENSCRITGDFKLPPDTSVRVRQHPRGSQVFLSLRKNVKDNQRLDAQPLLAILAGAYAAFTPVKQNRPISPGGVQ